MPKATQDYNLLILKPSLVKEWHPTKNAEIKPNGVTPGSGKRVWWLCQKGHEWKAVIYSRSRGSGCPYCAKLRSIDDGSLIILNSNLRLEWHPTKNLRLMPRDVTSKYPEKVWWICRQSHEWKATVQDRIKGKGCPICNQGVVKTLQNPYLDGLTDTFYIEDQNSMTDLEPADKIFGADFRKNKRHETRATTMLKIPSSGHIIYGQVKNFCHDGMGIESSASLRPGTKVNIKLDRPFFTSARQSYDSIIRWCKGITDENGVTFSFGLGVQFI